MVRVPPLCKCLVYNQWLRLHYSAPDSLGRKFSSRLMCAAWWPIWKRDKTFTDVCDELIGFVRLPHTNDSFVRVAFDSLMMTRQGQNSEPTYLSLSQPKRTTIFNQWSMGHWAFLSFAKSLTMARVVFLFMFSFSIFFSLIQQQQTIPITAVYVLASPILSRTRTRRSRSKKAAPKSRWRWLPTWAHTRPPCRTDIPCRLIKCGIREASIVEWVIAFDISRTTCIPFLLRTPHLLFFLLLGDTFYDLMSHWITTVVFFPLPTKTLIWYETFPFSFWLASA